jgi:Arylsulfotransferase (ASST)
MRVHPERICTHAVAVVATAALTLATGALAVVAATDDVPARKNGDATTTNATASRKLGLQLNDAKAFQGYTLVAPLNGKKTYLIDMRGRAVHSWESKFTAGQEAYFLENGHLLRAGSLEDRERRFSGAGQGGRVQEFDWDGGLVWDFTFHDDTRIAHHDICRLPNGNVLLIVWEIKTVAEADLAGRKPETLRGPWLADSIIEVKPTGKTTGQVVWEWHAWDHLIQDADSSKANFGDVGKHPELIDVNFGVSEMGFPGAPHGPPRQNSAKKEAAKEEEATKKRDMDRLRSLGYVGNPTARGNRGILPDWTHVNAVAYNADFDQIMISVRSFGEFWIIDHGTTTAEAAGHKGGKRGKGGDILYRWGNPVAYRAGTKADQRLFAQHDAHWIPNGYPGADHVLVFNNGSGRPAGNFSSVDEIVLPVDAHGNYDRTQGEPFGPREPVWSYTAPKKEDLFSFIMSGANRLPNGNTLICESVGGTIFEVTPKGETVWKYANPAGGSFPMGMPGGPPMGGPPTLADVLPPMFQFMLNLTPEQKTKLDATQKEVVGKLEAILDAAQKKQLLERRAADPMGFAGMATPGQILPMRTQVLLNLSAGQKTAVVAIQKDVDGKVAALLDDDQKDQIKQIRTMAARGGPPGRPGGPGAPPRGPGGPPGVPGGPPMGPPGGFGDNSVFRAYRYPKDYPGLAGKDLTPGKAVEELEAKRPEKTAN